MTFSVATVWIKRREFQIKDKRREDVKKRDDDLDLDLMFGIDEDNDEFKPETENRLQT